LVVDENLWHLANRGTTLFIERHALGFAVDLDLFEIKRTGFQQHLGRLALGACGLGVNDDFELHSRHSSDPFSATFRALFDPLIGPLFGPLFTPPLTVT
jgi:hypothetical protein